jgi:predicted metal-dependent phosphotriesterase family hydrolase
VDPYVQTVTGPVQAASLGFILPHEHVGLDYPSGHEPEHEPHDHPWEWWDVFNDEDVIADELGPFQALGGTCLVDMTNVGLGRDPERIRRISERTHLPIVMGCGWYRGSINTPESFLDRRTTSELAEEIIKEFREGVGATGIRPGVIGEIGTEASWVNPVEERVFRAVARASRVTGLSVATHAAQSRVGLAQLEILTEEGIDPSRIVIGHADSCPYLDYHLALLERGANIEFDLLGIRFGPVDQTIEPRVIGLLLELLNRGYADRILLSQAVGWAMQLKAYGGNGYVYIQEVFLPRLRERGVGEDAIHQMTVLNPRRVLSLS